MSTLFRLRPALFAILVLTLLFGAIRPVSAQELNPVLSAIHKFRLQNYLAINAFYNYSSSRDPELMAEIVDGVNQANGLMQTIADNQGELFNEEAYETLASHFQQYKELMNTNVLDVRENGYPDLRLVSELSDKASELNAQGKVLYDMAAESTASDNTPQVETAREASLVLAQMMSQYSIFSSSSVAQIFQGDSDSAPIDEQAETMDKLIRDLTGMEIPAAAQEAVSDARSTWAFIRGSYINYNERNVSFVINRYSKSIIQHLEAAIPELSGV